MVGPTVEAGAVVYREIAAVDALPAGVGVRQDAGRYVLRRRDDAALFGYVAAVQSWKPLVNRPSRVLWRATRRGRDLVIEQADEPVPKLAFLGVRACEIAAFARQDKALAAGIAPDTDYRARREAAFVIAVNCTEAGDTCFCASVDTGPRATCGFDLALTELVDAHRHDFLVQVGTPRGEAIAGVLPLVPATPADAAAADAGCARASRTMGRHLDTAGLKERLQAHGEHVHWEEVARRCLACTNCTLVCPTCFCHTTEDTASLDGASAEHRQRWDSCFTLDFSRLHGGPVRGSVAARYRQWITHKLAHWVDQFGESGCVGCGRCITWCPAGIDITAEAAALRARVEWEEEHGTPHA